MKESVRTIFESLMNRFSELHACQADILASFEMIRDTYSAGGKVLICGNGGSASDSEHIAGELMKGFLLKRKIAKASRDKLISLYGLEGEYIAGHLQDALPAISLTGHPALSSAYINDVAPDMVFAQQVFGFGKKKDVLLGMSTSGNSRNVVQAVKTAKAFGLRTIGMTGADGGALSELCDVTIRVPAKETYRVQEYHLPIYHALCAMLEDEFFGR